MRKYKIIVWLLLIFLFLIFISISNKKDEFIEQEVNPIRKSNLIVGFDYILKLNNVKDNKVIINSRILDSINHYKDISTIDNVFVLLKIQSDSKYKYLIDNIMIVDKTRSLEVTKLDYKMENGDFRLNFDSSVFSYYKAGCDVQIELVK